jgi:hypothetical protein
MITMQGLLVLIAAILGAAIAAGLTPSEPSLTIFAPGCRSLSSDRVNSTGAR